MQETAYAKINLALHIRRRRDDGYHELETLFAFVDDGDRLTVSHAAQDSLVSHGEFAAKIGDPFGNIVAKAMGQLSRPSGWAVALDKRLPVAAGLGGGSADAGAVFRMVERAQGLPDDWHARAARLGADVPACVRSFPCIGRGTGTELEDVAGNDLASCPVLLVNPRLPMPTGPVFAAWDGIDRGALPSGSLREIALAGRNDLEAGAVSLCPPISAVLTALTETHPFLCRMSGSGATCFALYEDAQEMNAAARHISEVQPDWWQMLGRLR